MRMMGVTAHGNGVSFRGGENFLKLVVLKVIKITCDLLEVKF